MRRCVFKEFNRNKTTKRYEESVCEGNFVQYGSNYEEFESGIGNYTCLVIEMTDGKVNLVHPGNVIKLAPLMDKGTGE